MRIAVAEADKLEAVVLDAGILARNWWVVLLRGVAGVAFGVLTFMWPGISLAALILLFGAYAFADGILSIVAAIRRHGVRDPWWMLVLRGVLGIASGVITLLWPGITGIALLYVIAAWALVTGGFEIAAAIQLRKAIDHEWLLALSGVASIGLGILLMLFPGPGALALVLWIGAYALVSGVLLAVLAFRLRSWASSHPPHGVFAPA